MLFSSIYSSKLLSVKVIVMDTQETHDSEEEKKWRNKEEQKTK